MSKSLHGCLRLDRHDPGTRRQQGLQFLLRRQKHALTDDVGVLVEEAVNRLEAEVGHSDEVGVRKRERDPQLAVVRFPYVADFARQQVARDLVLRQRLPRAGGGRVRRAGAATRRGLSFHGTAAAEPADRHSRTAPASAPVADYVDLPTLPPGSGRVRLSTPRSIRVSSRHRAAPRSRGPGRSFRTR